MPFFIENKEVEKMSKSKVLEEMAAKAVAEASKPEEVKTEKVGPEAKVEPVKEVTPEPQAKPETEPEAKPEAKAEPKVEPEAKAEAKAEPVPDAVLAETVPETVVTSSPASRPAPAKHLPVESEIDSVDRKLAAAIAEMNAVIVLLDNKIAVVKKLKAEKAQAELRMKQRIADIKSALESL